jgi:competence protein ComEC
VYKILLILSISAVILAVPAFWFSYPVLENFLNQGRAAGELEVDFLDVGQGDAILIKAPHGQNVLIDGGPDSTVIAQLGKALPFWDRTIDLMILTHPHDDHVTGLIEVINRYQVDRILYTGVVHTSPNYLAWLELVKDKKIPLTIIDRPQTVSFSENSKLEILYPATSLVGQSVDNLNNSSIVAKFVYKDIAFLFMGDAEIEVEEELIKTQNLASLRAQVIKPGHHGSDTSSKTEFIQAVDPMIAVIPVGEDNKFGHPSRRVEKRLERVGAEIKRTDKNGMVRISSGGKEIDIY